jgi:hypothetical protein
MHSFKELTIHTAAFVSVKAIEDVVKRVGFHVVPKSLFEL